MKPVTFLGDSLELIRRFPQEARREVGFQIDRVQRGLPPNDWKPMKTVGPGVKEIRVRTGPGAFRVIYIATMPKSVFILHAFQKKTAQTAKRDIELARTRFKQIAR